MSGKKYRKELSFMIKLIDTLAEISMDRSPVDTDIKLKIGTFEIDIPFNADSYERLRAFMEEEIKESKELDSISSN
jgi:hypothetical protein